MPVHATAASARRIEDLFAQYHAAWEARDPQRIAALHTEDTRFWLRDGSEPLRGREAVRQYCTRTFAELRFTAEVQRTLFGPTHWTLEWTAVVALRDTQGQPFAARIDMVDVVDVDDAGAVARKDVYMNGTQAQAAFARAGIARGAQQ